MTLADLSDRNAVLRAVAECDRLGRDEFLATHGFGRAYNYFLVVDGQDYDSKAIVGVAHGYQFPELGPLRSDEFSGGIATVVPKLEELGLEVRVLDGVGGPAHAYWWRGAQGERSWVEIRRVIEGLGKQLRCPFEDAAGRRNGWYDLLDDLEAGDLVYHWNAEQERFVGRSVVVSRRTTDSVTGERIVALKDFVPLTVDIGLDRIRQLAPQLAVARDDLEAIYPQFTLFLPFQFRDDGLRLMSNYFTKLPATMQQLLFGRNGLAEDELPAPREEDGVPVPSDAAGRRGGFLRPFRPRADTDYVTRISGGPFRRGRKHETLVNDFAAWLEARGLTVGSNAAIDLGIERPPVIIEAKVVRSGGWAEAIREAIGQLYEYRYFQVVAPDSALMFLASTEVPNRWLKYLDEDREVSVAWRGGDGFDVSSRGWASLGFDK